MTSGHWGSHKSFILPTQWSLTLLDICFGWYEFALCLVKGKRGVLVGYERKDGKRRGTERSKQVCPLFGPTEWLLELQETRPSVKRWKTCSWMRFKEKALFFWASCDKMGHKVWKRAFSHFWQKKSSKTKGNERLFGILLIVKLWEPGMQQPKELVVLKWAQTHSWTQKY